MTFSWYEMNLNMHTGLDKYEKETKLKKVFIIFWIAGFLTCIFYGRGSYRRQVANKYCNKIH